MTILFVANSPIENNKGGVQRVTVTLAKALQSLNIKVFYLSLCDGEAKENNGVEQFYLPKGSKLKNKSNQVFFKTLLHEKKIDLIINQAGVYGHIISFLTKNLLSSVKLYTVHHNCISCLQENYKNIIKGGPFGKVAYLLDFPWFWKLLLLRNKWKYGKYFKDAIAKSNKLVLLSETYIPELKTYVSSWPPNKVTSIYNPVPFKVYPDALIGKENRLLYLGRIEYTQKQCDLLLPIWKAIHQKFPNWHFDIVGGGSKLKELIELSKTSELRNIYFHGFCDPKPFLEKAKVLVMTSTFEGFPMVLVEAQAYGVVPIAFKSFNSLASIIEDDKNGIAIQPFDLTEYIEKLSQLLQNETKRFQMAEYGQQTVEKFMPEIIVQEWLNMIKFNN